MRKALYSATLGPLLTEDVMLRHFTGDAIELAAARRLIICYVIALFGAAGCCLLYVML